MLLVSSCTASASVIALFINVICFQYTRTSSFLFHTKSYSYRIRSFDRRLRSATPSTFWTSRKNQLLATISSNESHDEQVPSHLQQLLPEPIESLRPALNYLNAHPDTKLSREDWDALFRAIEQITANAEENNIQNQQAEQFPIFSKARQEMTSAYEALQKLGELRLYGAVSTQLPPAAGLNQVSPQLLEKILDLPISTLTPAPTNSLVWLGVALGLIEIGVAVTTGISFNTLGLLTLFVVALDRLFLNGASLETLLKWFSPGVQDKILHHEAGHALAAYLLGCPVEGIVLSAWAALKDERFGKRQISAGTSFFDPELSKQINQKQQVTRSSIDRYSIIVMAGIAAEAQCFGRADGGAGDEMALIAFLSRLWSTDKIKNQARWAAMQAVLMMRQYQPAYLALVDALERGGTLGDCIYAVEKAARDHDLPGRGERQPLGYICDDNGVLAWKLTNDTNDKSESLEQRIHSTSPQSALLDEEASLAALQRYKQEVEEKLREVDEKLKRL